MTVTTFPPDLHPGARLIHLVLEGLADESGEVQIRSADLLEATGWTNRASLRRRTHDLEDAGLVKVIPTYLHDGRRGSNIYRISKG